MYIFVILQGAKKLKKDVCGTYDFLGETGKFMCTYDILFLYFCNIHSFRITFFMKSAKKYAVSDLPKNILNKNGT